MDNQTIKKPKKNIELMKSTLIVVLSSIAILLLFLLWRDITIEEIGNKISSYTKEKVEIEIEEPQKLEGYIKPNKVELTINDDHSIIYNNVEEIWERYLEVYKRIVVEQDYAVSEITKDEWEKIRNSNGVTFYINYEMNVDDAVKIVLGEDIMSNENIGRFNETIFSIDKPDSIYFYNEGTENYYQLQANTAEVNFVTYINRLNEIGLPKYYTLNDFYGINSNVLIPYAINSSMQSFKVEKEIEVTETQKIDELAQTFFGEGFDFVRKITETDKTVVYLYKYGQKMLKVSKKGIIEYKEVIGNTKLNETTDNEKLLNVISFVASHGRWETLKGTIIYPYIKEINEIEIEGLKGKRYIFGYKIGGYPIYYNEGEAIIVDIVDDAIAYYKRQIYNEVDSLQYISDSNGEKMVIVSEILNKGYDKIRETYEENNKELSYKNEDEVFAEIVERIDSIEIGYYKLEQATVNETITVIPAWIIETEEFLFFYNLKTGNFLGYKIQED